MLRLRCFIFLGVLFFLPFKFFAQTPNFNFNRITAKHGLPYPDIMSILKDTQGYMWIGSAGGLFRFDGSRFHSYRHTANDSTSISGNIIYSIIEDGNDILCATQAGLSILDRNTGKFKNYSLRNNKPALNINSPSRLFKDPEGIIWIITRSGIIHYDRKKESFTPVLHDGNNIASITTDTMSHLAFTPDTIHNGLWIATVKGLNFYSYKEKKFYNYRNNPRNEPWFDQKPYYATAIIKNKLWAYTVIDSGLVSYDFNEKKKRITKFVRSSGGNISWLDLTSWTVDSKDNIVFGTWQSDPVYFETETYRTYYIHNDEKNPFSILGSFVRYLYTDDKGNIWFCQKDGISVLRNSEPPFRVLFPTRELFVDDRKFYVNIIDMKEDKNGDLWIGTDGAGLFRYDKVQNTFENFKFISDNVKDNAIFSICFINNEVWLGTRRGIKIFDRNTKRIRHFNDINDMPAFHVRTVYTITKDSKDRIWISNVVTGNYLYDLKTKKYFHFRHDKNDSTSIKPVFSYVFYEDKSHQIWVASPHGYGKFNEADSSFTHFKIDVHNPADFTTTAMLRLMEDSKDKIWLISYTGGVGIVDKTTGQKTIFTDANGLRSAQASDFCEDKNGDIWVSFDTGLMRWIRKENRFENIDTYYEQEIIDYTSILSSKSGSIYASNFNAVIEVNPSRLNAAQKPGSVLISVFNVFDSRLPVNNDTISLSYKQNFFSIGFSVPEDVFLSNVQYRYILEGFDKNWIESGSRKFASYTNVPGGDYVFKVQSRSGNQEWSDDVTTLAISISKIFYQTWWFRFILALIMFMVIRLYVRYREGLQEKKQEQNAINYFTHSQYTNNNADEILWDMARNVISRLGFEDCVIYLLDEKRNVLLQKAALDNKMKDDYTIENLIEIPVGKGIVGSVAAKGVPEIINDTSRDERYIIDDERRYSEITVPIIHKDKVIGVIDSEHPGKNFFTQKHLKLLTTIASISSDKIANAIARQELIQKEIEILEYDKKVAQMHLTALRAQMNPHFIFNCLNSIDNYIITKDPASASRYLNKFAKLIRLILNQSDKMNTTLEQEIEMLTHYLELESLRFDNKFAYVINKNENISTADIEIPAMIIQPFVENAVLHGLMNRRENGGMLRLNFEQENSTLHCIIEDNGIGREKANEIKRGKTGAYISKGMKMTEDRLTLLKQQAQQYADIRIIDLKNVDGSAAGTKVELAIPVLND